MDEDGNERRAQGWQKERRRKRNKESSTRRPRSLIAKGSPPPFLCPPSWLSPSSSSDDKDVEEVEVKETIYINFRDGKKGIVVDDDSLSSYRGQLVVDEYTKEPTGLRYKDDHLYDDDGHDLGSFSDLGNFYPNR